MKERVNMPIDKSNTSIYEYLSRATSVEEINDLIPKDCSPEDVFDAISELAFDGRDDVVKLLRQYNKYFTHAIVNGYARAQKHKVVEKYTTTDNIGDIIKGYIQAKNHLLVEEYRKKYNWDVSKIAYNYAFENDEGTEKYRELHHVSVDVVAKAYAHAGNDSKVTEYRDKHQASVHEIAKGYARAQNFKKVREYQTQYCAIIERSDYGSLSWSLCENDREVLFKAIAYYKAVSENSAQVDELRAQYVAVIKNIINDANTYPENINNAMKAKEYQSLLETVSQPPVPTKRVETIASLLQPALTKLKNAGTAGNTLIQVIIRLKDGSDNKWNPYWVNSGVKLQAILSAIMKMPYEVSLETQLEDKNSELYKAINWQRITSTKFLSFFGLTDKTKSLLEIEENNPKTPAPKD